MRQALSLIIFAACLSLTACLPDIGLGGDDRPPPIDVSKMTAAAPEAPAVPVLYCQVGRGSAIFGQEWYDFDDALFAMHQGARTNVKLTRLHSNNEMRIQALFDGSGQKMIFCPIINGDPSQRISCASLYALEEDLHEGIKRTFDIPAAVRGAIITCAYTRESLPSLNSPAAGGN